MALTKKVTPYSTGLQSTLVKIEEVPLTGLAGITGAPGTVYAMRLVNGAGSTYYFSLFNSGTMTPQYADIVIPLAATSTMVVSIDIGAPFDVAISMQGSTASTGTGDPGAHIDANLFIS